MSIGKVIQKLRTKRGFSQEQLADAAGIRQATLSDIERGKVKPSENTLEKISSALDASVNYIRIAAIEPDNIPKEQRSDFTTLFGDLLSNLQKLK